MKTQNPLIGRSSQKFANSIFSTWKTINVVRSKPMEVSNPRTPGQITQRNKFAAMVNLSRQYLNTAKLGLKSLAIRKSEYNVFIGENIELQNGDGTGINQAVLVNLVGSKGSLSNVIQVTSDASGNNILVDWSNLNRTFSTPLDRVCVGAFYRDTLGVVRLYREVSRLVLASAGNATYPSVRIEIAGVPTPESHIIIFAYNDSAVSDSTVVLIN